MYDGKNHVDRQLGTARAIGGDQRLPVRLWRKEPFGLLVKTVLGLQEL
jgi:hypothetical protein